MRKTLVIIPLVSLLLTSGVSAAQPDGQKPKAPKDERVEITGSHIRQKVTRIGFRTDSVTPVLVFDRTYMDRTGAFTVADVLRRVPFAQVRGR